MKKTLAIVLILSISLFFVVGCGSDDSGSAGSDFKKLCNDDGNRWMKMSPIVDGVPTGEAKCSGCMVGSTHFCSQEEYSSSFN